jgi:hypothetical protein
LTDDDDATEHNDNLTESEKAVNYMNPPLFETSIDQRSVSEMTEMEKASMSRPLMEPPMLTQFSSTPLRDHLRYFVYLASVTDLPFMGELVGAITVFDLLGWLMSVTANPDNPPNTTATELNFHLPYLTLFARWCILLSTACVADRKVDIKGSARKQDQKALPVMVSIAYFDYHSINTRTQASTSPRPPAHPMVFMGSTLGLSSMKTHWAWPARLRTLGQYYYIPETPNDSKASRDSSNTADSASTEREVVQYGACAETMFWELVAQMTGREGRRYECSLSPSFLNVYIPFSN